jgi:hypothetical protein
MRSVIQVTKRKRPRLCGPLGRFVQSIENSAHVGVFRGYGPRAKFFDPLIYGLDDLPIIQSTERQRLWANELHPQAGFLHVGRDH